MTSSRSHFPEQFLPAFPSIACLGRRVVRGGRWLRPLLLLVCTLGLWLGLALQPAWAVLNDDHYDGDIFTLYAGNGSLVPPKISLAEAQKRDRPIFLGFYVDDSSDCKQYAPVISQLQGLYGRAADFVWLRVDSLPVKQSYGKDEAGYYYEGFVPQTILFDKTGKIVLNARGKLTFEQLDDVFRQVFDLLPRSESVALKRRQVNEFNTELTR